MNKPIQADSYGDLLKYWRKQRGVNQTELALECDTSSRHLSCVETERAQPSRHLLLRLCATLEVPLRARNSILISAGYAPLYRETGLSDPEMVQARKLLENILKSSEPNPTMLLDRNMDIIMRNQGMESFFEFFMEDPGLLEEDPPNLLRLVLHPGGIGPSIVNYDYVHLTMVERARRSLLTGAPDQRLRDVLQEVMQFSREDKTIEDDRLAHLVMPLEAEKNGKHLTIATTSATLGSNLNVTLQELFIETAYPMDAASEEALHSIVTA
jgi:transcriptional regulator with XRE-family HTH domain